MYFRAVKSIKATKVKTAFVQALATPGQHVRLVCWAEEEKPDLPAYSTSPILKEQFITEACGRHVAGLGHRL